MSRGNIIYPIGVVYLKILYYDCFCGISGDMNLGAMADIGVDTEYIKSELSKLSISDDFEVVFNKSEKKGISGTKADVILKKHEHPHRHLKDVYKIINDSDLNENIKKISKRIFENIAIAEGKVHGKPMEKVHFHEVGAIDSIVDVVGAAICYDSLDINGVYSSSVQVGGGFVNCAHGKIPVPAPATVELLTGIPIKTGLVDGESTTPTGAAILKSLADGFTNNLSMDIKKTGYGLGTKDFDVPNVLRVYIAEMEDKKKVDEIQYMIEANIDDMNPEYYSHLEEKLFEGGALDVYKTQILMKKSRPAVKLSILCSEDCVENMEEVIFLHSSTLGVRKYKVEKSMLERKIIKVKTQWGEVRVKQGFYKGKLLKQKAEYEDCLKIAKDNNLELDRIYRNIYKQL